MTEKTDLTPGHIVLGFTTMVSHTVKVDGDVQIEHVVEVHADRVVGQLGLDLLTEIAQRGCQAAADTLGKEIEEGREV